MKNTNKQREKNNGALFNLLMKQIIAASICFILLIGMKSCPIKSLNDCASAFGRALRHDMSKKFDAENAVQKAKSVIAQKGWVFK